MPSIFTNIQHTLAGILVAILLVLPSTNNAHAHEVRPSIVDIKLGGQNSITLEIRLNLEAVIANIDPRHKNTNESRNADRYNTLRSFQPARLKQAFAPVAGNLADNIFLKAGKTRIALKFAKLTIPPVGDTDLARTSSLSFTGTLPEGTKQLDWSWNARYGDAILRIDATANDKQTKKVFAGLVRAGKSSGAVKVENQKPLTGWQVFRQYIVIGFEHIVPEGLDHILFVVGLFLLSSRLSSLLWQISSFTIAHTITLGLAMAGIISAPSSWVEPLIALSIVFVAVENIFTSTLHRWRPFVVFGFGLLHGLGFASVLSDVGLDPSRFVAGLVGFNIGVEVGQLAVITVCFALVGLWFRHKSWYRQRITNPASLFIAVIASWWFVERAFL